MQNSVSLLYIMLEIHLSGRKTSLYYVLLLLLPPSPLVVVVLLLLFLLRPSPAAPPPFSSSPSHSSSSSSSSSFSSSSTSSSSVAAAANLGDHRIDESFVYVSVLPPYGSPRFDFGWWHSDFAVIVSGIVQCVPWETLTFLIFLFHCSCTCT